MRMLRRLLFGVLPLEVDDSSIPLPMLDSVLLLLGGDVKVGGHDCVASGFNDDAIEVDDLDMKLPILLRNRRMRLPSSLTLPI